MEILVCFLVAFFFSFIGTIPPGTLNLTIIQMGLEHRSAAAWKFAFAASAVEYVYAWIAVKFEKLIMSSSGVTEHFELVAALVMIAFGAFSLITVKKPTGLAVKFRESGFRKGMLLGILNPLALPFWVAMTAYIQAQGWVELSTTPRLHAYLIGVVFGAFALLISFFYLARKLVNYFRSNTALKRIPGATLIVLGVYGIFKYFL